MKKQLSILFAAALLFSSCGQPKVTPVIPADPEIEKKIDQLISKMTLDEKIGQMTELVLDLMGTPGQNNSGDNFTFNEAILDSVITKYKVGSILNAPGTVGATAAKWNEIIARIQEKSMKEIGIPCLYGLDQNHGTTYTIDGTFFPQNLNMGATFNRALTEDAARITAYETKASSVPWTYCPTLDLARNSAWPRVYENFGEDCYVNAQMGAAAVRGFQGEDPNHIGSERIAACLKHYMGYGAPVSGQDRTPAVISEEDLREKHFAPYLEAIKAGALSVMINSASVNGIPGHANYRLLTQWLKEETGWDGMIVTDWADINQLWMREKIAANKKEAIKIAVNAGIDMAMEPYQWDYCTLLKELVEEGEVPMSRIDDATRRVLRVKFRLGLFDTPTYKLADFPLFASAEHAAVSEKAAEESMILLKNTANTLPLKKGARILVTGPNANSIRVFDGGWSYTWQGDRTDEFTEKFNTIYEAVSAKFGQNNVVYEPGVTYKKGGAYWEENTPEISKAVSKARGADVILACIGENSYCETPGNLSDLTLSRNQLDLVNALAATGKPVVLILSGGRGRIIGEIEPKAKAIVDILLPGNYGGDALANLLIGEANFSGRLPYTYQKSTNAMINYDYKVSEQVATMAGAYDYNANASAQWPFGFGLSYTTFEYSNLTVDKTQFAHNDNLTVSIDVKNSGKVAGKESVLLFSTDLVASVVPDNRRLRAFDKIELQPGETKTVTFSIPASELAFVGSDGKWLIEKGDFRFFAGSQATIVTCTDTYKWETPNR